MRREGGRNGDGDEVEKKKGYREPSKYLPINRPTPPCSGASHSNTTPALFCCPRAALPRPAIVLGGPTVLVDCLLVGQTAHKGHTKMTERARKYTNFVHKLRQASLSERLDHAGAEGAIRDVHMQCMLLTNRGPYLLEHPPCTGLLSPSGIAPCLLRCVMVFTAETAVEGSCNVGNPRVELR